MTKPNCKGFTLVEIMIVAGILILIATIAIPQLLRIRLNANESAAIATLHTLSYALEGFQATNPDIGFPDTLEDLDPPGETAHVNPILAVLNPTRHGYNFSYTSIIASPTTQYHVYAEPVNMNVTGIRGFYVDEQGVVCYIPQAAGDPGHAPIGSVKPPGYIEVE